MREFGLPWSRGGGRRARTMELVGYTVHYRTSTGIAPRLFGVSGEWMGAVGLKGMQCWCNGVLR